MSSSSAVSQGVLALFSALPVLGQRTVPMRVRVALSPPAEAGLPIHRGAAIVGTSGRRRTAPGLTRR